MIANETELVAFLDEIDAKLKALGKRHGIALFNQLMGREHEDLMALNQETAAILLNAENKDTVETWRDRVTDSRLKRRLDIFSMAFLSAQVENDPEIAALRNPLNEKIIRFQPEIDGKKLTRTELGKILETSPDREMRKKAYYAGKVLDTVIENDVRELFEKRNELARKTGRVDFVALGYTFQELDEAELRNLFEQVKEQTQSTWDDLLERIAAELGISVPEPWDIGYYLHTILKSPADARFPKDKIIPIFKETLRKCGGDLDALPIQVIYKDLPYGGLCMGIENGKDVRIIANPRDGLLGYDALFHEFGHAIHASLIDTSSFLVTGGDPPFFWEGVAGIFERIVHEPAFQKEHFGLTDQEVRELAVQTKFTRISWFRRIAVACLLEWSVYRGDSNPRQTAANLSMEYLGISIPVDVGWAGNTLYTTHPLYNQNYLLMDVMALQTIRKFRSEFNIFPGPDLLEFVRENYIAPAAWIPWADKVFNATGEKLTPDALTAYLTE